MQLKDDLKTYYVETFGCAMNIADSERFRTILGSRGLEEADFREEADLLVFNTCSVRQSAEDRVLGLGPAIKELKKKNPKLTTILTGCMARRQFERGKQDKKYKSKLREQAPWLDYIIETTEFHKLGTDKVFLDVQRSPMTKATAGITISHGCDHMCSFCIVPFARGREIIRGFEPILEETKKAVENGTKDIVLLGQTVNRWINPDYLDEYLNGGYVQTKIAGLNEKQIENLDSTPKDFLQLLEVLDNLEGDFWISFMSSHPNYFTNELIDFIAESVKSNLTGKTGHMRPFIHLALQSGNDEILKKMRRNHTIKEFTEKVEYMKKVIPEVAVTTDIIVGFPGETKEQFQDTLNVCEKLEFDQIYISEYSEREGTGSSFMKNNVPHEEKEKRKHELNKVLAKTALKNNKKLVGTTQKVLITNEKRGEGNTLQGRTSHNKLVQFKTKSSKNKPEFPQIGQFVALKITSATPWALEGRLI